MTSEPQHARGRHAKPPSKAAIAGERVLAAMLAERNRRKLVAAAGGTVSAVVAVTAAALILPGAAGPGKATSAEASARTAAPAAVASPAADGTGVPVDADEDAQAVGYLKAQDPKEKVVKHVREVRKSGAYLRIYTDLPEEDENSRSAISLCEWATDYLKSTRGDDEPIVFVHAKKSGNGHVVLANKDSAKDNCRVGITR